MICKYISMVPKALWWFCFLAWWRGFFQIFWRYIHIALHYVVLLCTNVVNNHFYHPEIINVFLRLQLKINENLSVNSTVFNLNFCIELKLSKQTFVVIYCGYMNLHKFYSGIFRQSITKHHLVSFEEWSLNTMQCNTI